VSDFRTLAAEDPQLRPTRDPHRSRSRLLEATVGDPERDIVRHEVLAHLDEHGVALADRTTMPGHLTGSALVIDPSSGLVLVLLHAKLRRWLQPGGHADGDHELAGVALREATEESGIEGLEVLVPAVDVDIHRVDHGDALGEHLHLDLRFAVVAPAGANAPGNHESIDRRWVGRSELEGLADDPGVLRLHDAGRRALGFS